jgi:outer membrane protein
MTAAKNRYQALVEQVTAYAESFRAAEVRFNAGASTSVDYLIAKNNLDRANVNLIIARYDYVLRTKILDYYQGKPLW